MKQLCCLLAVLLVLSCCSCSDPGPQSDNHYLSTGGSHTQFEDTSTGGTETGTSQTVVQPEPPDDAFVRISDYIPDAVIELPYAGKNNFTGQTIYEFSEPFLRYGTVKKLLRAQELLKQKGMCLKIWDGFRPPSAQFKLWSVCPDPTYVSDPTKSFSSHSRGNTVDITMVYADGAPVVMPTGFDDFSTLADRDYSDCPPEAAANARLLEQIMSDCGFKGYYGEWWHYTDIQAYPVDENFEPTAPSAYYANCNEFITLRTGPNTSANAITHIPAGGEFHVVALCADFALVDYQNLQGYVLKAYILPMK